MDETAPDTTQTHPPVQEAATEATQNGGGDTPKKTAAEYAETFGKAVDVAEQVLRFAPLPTGAKRIATRAMPTVKKIAKVAPLVAPAAEPYVRKAAEKAKEAAPEIARSAKEGAHSAASRVQAGARSAASHAQSGAIAAASGTGTLAGHVRATAPKIGHALSNGAKAAAAKVPHRKPSSRKHH